MTEDFEFSLNPEKPKKEKNGESDAEFEAFARNGDGGVGDADDETGDGGAGEAGREVADEVPGTVTMAGVDAEFDAPSTAKDEVEPVELLVQLAKDGEIAPWDIDIVRVTDAFLSRLDETDLRTSGRALFYASVLLRMKGDELLAPPEDESEPDPEPWELAMEGGDPSAAAGFDPVDALEEEMDRRLERKRARGSPETLEELVHELREAERDSWWKRSREYDTSDSPRGFSRGTQTLDYHAADDFRRDDEPTAADVTDTAHAEDIEAVIEDVEAELRPQFEAGRSEVLFAEVRSAGGRAFMTYLALLFLAHRGRVRLRQDDLFGDLWVREAPAEDEADAPVAAD